jgi:hypothetical protein
MAAKRGKLRTLVTLATTVGPIVYKFYKIQQAKKSINNTK